MCAEVEEILYVNHQIAHYILGDIKQNGFGDQSVFEKLNFIKQEFSRLNCSLLPYTRTDHNESSDSPSETTTDPMSVDTQRFSPITDPISLDSPPGGDNPGQLAITSTSINNATDCAENDDIRQGNGKRKR